MAILRTKSSNLLGIDLRPKYKVSHTQFKYLTESAKLLFKPKAKVRRRTDGLPREWDRNHFYIGDSWTIHGSRLINIKSREFWSLRVLERDRTRSSRAYSYWICECTCGRRYSIRSDRLRNGSKFCCIECKRKIDKLYNRIEKQKIYEQVGENYISPEDKKRIGRENAIINQKKRMKRIKVTHTLQPTRSLVHVPGRLYSKGSILEMRDHHQMSIKEIADELSLTPDEVREGIRKGREQKEKKSSEPLEVYSFAIKTSHGMSASELKKYIESQNQKQSS